MELLNPLADSTYPGLTASYSGTAGNTANWNAGPQGVLVWSTTECYVAVGEGAVATSASTPIPAYTPIPFTVPLTVSGLWRVSALRVATDGAIYCKPINIR